MKKSFYIFSIVLLGLYACEDSECPPSATQFSLDVSATFEGEPAVIFDNYVNYNGYDMSFEDLRMYLSEISLIKSGGELVALSEIEYFNFADGEASRLYDVAPGDYEGLIYHIGVPQALNGTDDPDFLTSQYGPESPLNIQNGMYWSWQAGYRFQIYEGRIDGTPDDDTDLPSVFSIHLGKDQYYTEMQVDLPFTITEGQTKHFGIEWDLAKSQYNDSDSLDLSIPAESQYHGAELELATRYQAILQDAFVHSVE